jgi:hypothetical protein
VIDVEVTAKRDALPLNKRERDQLRCDNQMLRQQNGLLGNTPLLRDFEDKVVSSGASYLMSALTL